MENSLMVLGPLAAVALGLLAYLVYLWLQYYEDASRMESRETQFHHQSQANLLAGEQARIKTGQTLERCRALEEDLPAQREQLAQLRQAGSGQDG